ncbi:MAG: FKBP-type peptidyl-prolyl cis-trans isomerase [Acidothermaceae bacterium]
MAGKERRRQIARERYERRLQARAAARAKSRQRWTIGGAAAAVVAIIGVVLAFVLPGSGKPAASASSPAAVSSASGSAPASSPPASSIPPAPTHADGCTSKPSVVASPIANFPIIPGGIDPALRTEPSVTIPAGTVPITLQTKDLVVGTGETVKADDTVTVNYLGLNYIDCSEFDSSWAHSQEATFQLSQVVPGFGQGVTGMKVGGRREIIIPPSLGYGAAGSGSITPNEELVFVVDVLATTHSTASPTPASS